MTKVICVNRKRFEQGIGYTAWTIITITLILFSLAAIIEFDNIYDDVCYQSILFNYEECDYWMSDIYVKLYVLEIMMILNFCVIAGFIYNKQQKFKLSWCEKDD